MAQQLKKKFLGNDQVDGSKILLENGQAIRIKDSLGVEQELIKLGASNEVLVKGQEVAIDADLQQEITDRQNADSAIQSELDATQVGAGLEPDGSFLADPGAAYTSGSSSLFGAIGDLDSALNGIEGLVTDLQDDTASIKTGAGLGVDGSYTPPAGSNYLGSAVSLNDADSKLDAQIKDVADDVASLTSSVGSTYIPLSQKGAANGVATLGADSKIPSSQLPALQSLMSMWLLIFLLVML
jgi:hypothetical protein